MSETRVEKYRQYRNSFTKEGSITMDSSDVGFTKEAFTSLSIDEVMKNSNKVTDNRLKHRKRKKVIKRIFIIAVISIIVAGLVVFGIYAFGGFGK